MNVNMIKLELCIRRTKIFRIFYIYIGSSIQTIYYLIRYKFDMDKIHITLDQLRKNTRYEMRKEKERHLELMTELKKKHAKLQRAINEKINSKRF